MNFLVRIVTALSAMTECAPKRMESLKLLEGRRRRETAALNLSRDDKKTRCQNPSWLIKSLMG